MPVPAQQYLDKLLTQAALVERETTQLSKLSPLQLNWKPDPDSWSIAQCIEHLVKLNKPYLGQLARMLKPGDDKLTAGKGTFRSGLIGKWFAQLVGPDAKKKIPAPKAFQPARSEVPGDILDQFLKQQRELAAYISSARGVDLGKVKVRSPLSKLMRFRLGDVFLIIINHEIRHIAQAKRVMQVKGFPRW